MERWAHTAPHTRRTQRNVHNKALPLPVKCFTHLLSISLHCAIPHHLKSIGAVTSHPSPPATLSFPRQSFSHRASGAPAANDAHKSTCRIRRIAMRIQCFFVFTSTHLLSPQLISAVGVDYIWNPNKYWLRGTSTFISGTAVNSASFCTL
ncbi:hypothetical protein DQ04_03381110 [Trypanosoma grayi]|uniref:hypothetical protein n=1 Tax=Trypanosoma grayi TaxID=71804 RepID=UPI0004F43A91|nr:hypothetical protein DQ04_03381110 [Trypanosoma grayi]KEG10719.1 hypothetical protein DQ04_03381110 [Trypanosoma grayi]